ncbi:MAG: hypothetical protein WB661_06855 [Candidatus Bathyarchaeia archaeon]
MTEIPSKDESTPLGSRGEFNSHPSVQIPPPAPFTEPTGVMGEFFSYAFWMQERGCRPSTTRGSIHTLKAVARKVNLLNQDMVITQIPSCKVVMP